MRHQPHARSVKCSIALPLRGSWRHVYSRTVTTTTSSRRRVYSRAAAPAAAAADAPAAPAAYDALQQWLIEEKGALEQRVELTQVDEDQLGPRSACRATADIRAGQVRQGICFQTHQRPALSRAPVRLWHMPELWRRKYTCGIVLRSTHSAALCRCTWLCANVKSILSLLSSFFQCVQIAACTQVVCRVPEDAAVTMVDAANHPAVGRLADGRGEVVSLALWLLAEREKPDSEWAPLLQALPVRTPNCDCRCCHRWCCDCRCCRCCRCARPGCGQKVQYALIV